MQTTINMVFLEMLIQYTPMQYIYVFNIMGGATYDMD